MVRVLSKAGLVIVISVVLIVSLFISAFFVFPLLNDMKANSLVEKLNNIELPDNTSIIDTISFVGNAGGTGNHTDIYMSALIYSDLSEKELSTMFTGDLYKVDKQNMQTYIMKIHDLRFAELDEIKDYSNYFIIENVDKAVSSFFDLRGH